MCTDCGWTYTADTLEPVADALERHAQKDHHHVELHRHPAVPP